MQDNFSAYTFKKKKIGHIARFQALHDETDEAKQLDFFADLDTIFCVYNDQKIDLLEVAQGSYVTITVSFAVTYPDKIFITVCRKTKKADFCVQKTIDVTKGYWKLGKLKLNQKVKQ